MAEEAALPAFVVAMTFIAITFPFGPRVEEIPVPARMLVAGAAVVTVVLRHRFPATGLLLLVVAQLGPGAEPALECRVDRD